ncbi:MAG TPA: hypothetical protein VKB52_08995 [Rhodanobacteraceae bacterium]|nr:hypothetical protein [Rhodanobacteraceae bacterium]
MRIRFEVAALAALALAGAHAPLAQAQSSGGPYRIDRVVIAGGGGPIDGGAYQVSGTFGQSAIARLAASDYVLFDGFWSPASFETSDRIFANGFDP